MMASIIVCSRVKTGKVERKKVDGILLANDVSIFRSTVSEVLGVSRTVIELIYCGRVLRDYQTLDSYGVKPGVTVHALSKPEPQDSEISVKMEENEVQQVVTALQSAMINPAYRNTVERLLSDPEALKNIIAATPGLDNDPIGIAMLQDPEMLAVLADPDQVKKVIEAHPALGQAAMLVAAAVNEEAAKGTSSSGSTRATYSLDQMSDDEDMPSQRIGQMQPGGGASQMITASQLAAALAAASAGASQTMATANSSGSPAGSSTRDDSSSSHSFISDAMFRQAMMASSTSGSTPNDEQEQAAQLAQLRDMGITDERVAREALQATGGDIQAALELIFGDENFN